MPQEIPRENIATRNVGTPIATARLLFQELLGLDIYIYNNMRASLFYILYLYGYFIHII